MYEIEAIVTTATPTELKVTGDWPLAASAGHHDSPRFWITETWTRCRKTDGWTQS